MKNIAFISTRISGTDGVSHEIEKWATVLEGNGFACFYCAGEIDRPPDRSFVIDEAHFRHPDVARVTDALFGRTVRPREMTELVRTLAAHLGTRLEEFVRRHDIHCIIAENSLTIPMNIPLGMALTVLIAETGMPTLAHHHDFYWERERFFINAAGDYLQAGFPPVLPSIRHVVINTLAQASLAYRRGVTSSIIPNTFDFRNPPRPAAPGVVDAIRREAGVGPGEHLVLQPTRVVPRKAIERSVDLVSQLGRAGRRLVISHPAGDEGDEYLAKLQEYASMRGVSLVFIDHVVAPGRAPSVDRPFTIADVYQAADLVTYPSSYEGFGNAFLEAVYFRKPLVMNRYPVFIADIEPKGFNLCLIDGFVTRSTVAEAERLLADEAERGRVADLNYRVAGEHFAFEHLEERLLGALGEFTPRSRAR